MLTDCSAPLCPPPRRIVPSYWMYHLPFAFWVIKILRPSLLVELGSWYGASFCAFCQAIEQLGLSCQAYAVDHWIGDEHMGAYGDDVFTDLQAYIAANYASFASLLRMKFDEAAGQFNDGSIDLLHLDGCHTAAAIIHDFETWLPKISPRGIILIHDICTRFRGYGGVEAWNVLERRFPSFAFSHGYGLGVVLVGKEAPVELKTLASSPDQAALLRPFREQSKIYEHIFAMQEKAQEKFLTMQGKMQAEASKAAAREADLEQTISRLRDILEQERREHAKQHESLRDAIIQEQLRANALTTSLSWRITAPLRKLSALCRRP